jgi:hypothetical protein
MLEFLFYRLVEEGVMDQEANQNLLTNHSNQMSFAFKEADSYYPSATPTYSQVGEEQSKSLKVVSFNGYLNTSDYVYFLFGTADGNWRRDVLGHWCKSRCFTMGGG